MPIHFHFLTVVLLAFTALSVPAQLSFAASDPTPKAIVFVTPIKRGDLFDVLTYPSRAVPKVNTTVLSESESVVIKLWATLGSKIKRGQKLMTLKHTDPAFDYSPVVVTSPVNGVVSQIDVTEGTQVSKGQKLASVVDPSKIKFTVEIPAQDLGSLGTGSQAEFILAGQDIAGQDKEGQEKGVPVKITGISPSIDPATGTASCELEAMSLSGISPGTLGRVIFKTNNRKGISIPDHAIFFKGTDTFVRLLDKGKAKHVAVRLGKKQRGLVEVLTGIPDKSSLIERSSRFVADGEEVATQETTKTKQ